MKKEKKLHELEERYKRVLAELANFQKRAERDKQVAVEQAVGKTALPFLGVYQNFQRALAHLPKHLQNDPWAAGVMATEKHFLKILEEAGIKKIEVSPGDKFNPEKHEAVMTEKNKHYKEGEIIEIVEEGFTLKDKIISPAKVKVNQ